MSLFRTFIKKYIPQSVKDYIKRRLPVSRQYLMRFFTDSKVGKDFSNLEKINNVFSCLEKLSKDFSNLEKMRNEILNIKKDIECNRENIDYLINLIESEKGCKKIDYIELFFDEVTYKREFSFGSWPTRLHCYVRVVYGECSGWGEIMIPLYENSSRDMIIEQTTKKITIWKDTTIEKAKFLVIERRGKTDDRILEAMDMALTDLSARIEGKSVLEYIGLDDDYAVPALHCILKKDINEAVELARQKATTHLKIKLFGDNVHDYNLIKAVRKVIPSECYLVGDVNMGYGNGKEMQKFDQDIVRALKNLNEAGLNACEDPINYSWEDLEKLQHEFDKMAIIPDESMRPSYKIIKEIKPVEGHIYNLHPNCMGSLIDTIRLAQKLKDSGAGVMIGDSSLVGPACIAWQQIACGIKADWCEAIEKREESTTFFDCLTSSPMETLDDGSKRIKKYMLGFGIEVDVEMLQKKCVTVTKI